jgi:hypothetical protein
MDHSSLDIKIKRFDRVYRQNEHVEGTITVNAKAGWTHKGVNLIAEGTVFMSNGKGLGVIESGPDQRKVTILKYTAELAPSGKFADGSTDVPFDFPVVGVDGQALLESYHGVYLTVIYNIHVDCERGMMKKTLHRDLEFVVEVPTAKSKDAPPMTFDISPQSLEGVNSSVVSTIPKFHIVGRLHKSTYPINLPFTGEVVVKECEVPIRSMELQLVRVETIITDGKPMKESTEIQNIQIGEGNICRDMIVPLYMVFPRLFSCPTVLASQFKLEFEVNLIVVFGEGYMITENFPITISREF